MFPKSLRLLAAWWLLALMALTVTPRELLHQCGPADTSHQEDGTGATVKNICPICDAALPVAVAEDVALVSTAVRVSAPTSAPIVTAPAFGHERLCADRGPPSA